MRKFGDDLQSYRPTETGVDVICEIVLICEICDSNEKGVGWRPYLGVQSALRPEVAPGSNQFGECDFIFSVLVKTPFDQYVIPDPDPGSPVYGRPRFRVKPANDVDRRPHLGL